MNPLHDVGLIANTIQMTGEYFDQSRRSGRSTALALTYISQAILHPYKPIIVVDHEQHKGVRASVAMNVALIHKIADMVAALKLQHFTFSTRDGTITFGTPVSGSVSRGTTTNLHKPLTASTLRGIEEAAWGMAFNPKRF